MGVYEREPERKKEMQIAVMGFGTVGSGVVELIDMNSEIIAKSCGQENISVKYILDIREFPGSKYQEKIIHDFEIIANDPEIGVVVETMGGINPAFGFIKKCLESKKSVVTSNKELVAMKGFELLSIARENNVSFMFEASVGGGIPIIRPLSRCLAANKIEAIAGILNGTTNYILTQMIDKGESFETALAAAQTLGYAEKDPTADVEGFDALRKICILASIAYDMHVYPKQATAEGITKITLSDVAYADRAGFVIKLIADVRALENDKICAQVSPALVKKSSQLAAVNGVFNACLIRGNAVGDVVLYGQGAGKMATASAVVGDVIDCICCGGAKKCFGWTRDADESKTVSADELEVQMMIVGSSENPAGALRSVTEALGQVEKLESLADGEVAFITPMMTRKNILTALEGIEDFTLNTAIRVVDY